VESKSAALDEAKVKEFKRLAKLAGMSLKEFAVFVKNPANAEALKELQQRKK